ncbi:MAG: sulfite exporter TauE/SafE family protein [Sulfurimonas sp.]|jgi:uncharacterized membrane protein YfcA|nr:sulfite exporter TauE/SafE family protein [Sulfurimonadaceae bacterium]
MIEYVQLLFLGSSIGLLSGFFGIGGGTILVPALMFLGHATKDAIGISVVQMVFSSIYGSYLNRKNKTLDVKMGLILGSGGFLGGLISGFVVEYFADIILETLFLSFAIFALIRLFMKLPQNKTQKEIASWKIFILGFVLGLLGMLIGVGGSILLVPILVGFLHVDMKRAISSGLFFVVFSSLSGLISHTLGRGVDLRSGVIIGVASLVGVYVGIALKQKVEVSLQKRLLVFFYLLVVIYLSERIIYG